MKRAVVAAAISVVVGALMASGIANAIELSVSRMDFYPPGTTTPVFTDDTIGANPAGSGSPTADSNSISTADGGSGGFSSDVGPIYGTDGDTDGFFGEHWTATVDFAADSGSGAWTGTGFSYEYNLAADQYAFGLMFSWSGNNIPVMAVFQCEPGSGFGSQCTPVDTDGDGTPGTDMQTPPFPGQTPAFSGSVITEVVIPGAPTFTPPADIVEPDIAITATPAIITVELGTVTDEDPPTSTIDYFIEGVTPDWLPDDGTNLVDFELIQTVNTFVVEWRADNQGDQSFKTQNVTLTIDDQVAPDIVSAPADVNTTVTSTADCVPFGALSVTDAIDPNPTVEWSHDGFNWFLADSSDNCSTGFGPDANTMNWRAIDATGNTVTYTQNVILNLPVGITGKACTIDLTTAEPRMVDGRFTMRDPTGAIAGSVDNTVTGDINTDDTCNDADPLVCNPEPPAASLVTQQPFFGFTWTATPIRLYGEGTWSFEACPFPRSFDAANNDWVSPDGSNKCGDEFTPNLISMTVGPGQLGAHMLFDWSVNPGIDVVVVWDADCSKFELTTTDPDGDGILSTPMVDGPFKGFNAAFDLNTLDGEVLIADGGYTTTIAVVENPVSGESPIPLTLDTLPTFTEDPDAVRSCVGGCAKFTTTDLLDGDDGSAYQYAQIVLPLDEATPFWSLYRKYDEATDSWGPFVIDGRNDVKTAPLDTATGECPQPGNGDYDRPISGTLADKLRDGDLCVQLTIEDGGPNDADGAVDGSVSDPGGVAEVPASGLPSPSTSGGGCSVSTSNSKASATHAGHWWLLAGFIGWLGWHRRKGFSS